MNKRIVLAVLFMAGCTGKADIIGGPDPLDPVDPIKPDPTLEPAKLTVTAKLSATMASVGQPIELEVTVSNVGQSTATGVTTQTPLQLGVGHAALMTAPTPPNVDLEAGAMHTFKYVFQATDPGALTFEVGADGTDPAHELSVVGAPAQVSLVIEGMALLAIDALDVPATSNVGSDVTVKVTVSNGGQSKATAVAPALTLSGVGQAALMSGPTPASADLAGGATQQFTFVYRPSAAGQVTFRAIARGTDEHSAEAVTSAERAANPVEFETPAALEVTMTVPTPLATSQQFTATLVVKNTGMATAKAVLPDPLTPAVSGAAGATTTSMPQATDIPGGGTATFTWSFTASGTGALTLSAGARGVDGNSLQAVTVAPDASNAAQVNAPGALQVVSIVAPTMVNRTTAFNVVMTVRNNGGGAVSNVQPTAVAVASTGGAAATTASMPAAQNIAAGATATFTWSYTENGASPGTLAFSVGARGTAVATNTMVTAATTQSNLVVVVTPPALLIDQVTMPARLSRGQTFDVTVIVRNTGGSAADNVVPNVVMTPTGGAGATLTAQVAPQSIAGGARGTFRVVFREDGAANGTLRASATATGLDTSAQRTVTSPSLSSSAATVQQPAQLNISVFSLPAQVNRGQGFSLAMTVQNTGEAAALGVVPSPAPPTAALTGGVMMTSTSTIASAVTIPGGASQTFIWLFTESGGSAGTLAFTGTAMGRDENSAAVLMPATRTTNTASVQAFAGCNGALFYSGFGGASLDADRLDGVVGNDRLRVKPYSMLPSEYQRVMGLATAPGAIVGQAATFNAPAARWDVEPQLSAVSLIQAFNAAFQGCLTFTGTATQFSANPTTTTAPTQCTAMAQRFWSRTPTAAEVTACSTFATSAANNDVNPRRRWAYVCATLMSSVGFLAH